MRFTILAALLVLSALLRAQEKQVTGVVLEESGKGKFSPIQGAGVHWLGTTMGVITDSAGVFNLEMIGGANRLVIDYVGYATDTILVGGPDKITVVLKNANNLKEVQVEYRQKSTTVSRIDPMKVQQIGQKELFKAACCNLSESFETNPSVDVAFTDAVSGAKQIQLLGLAGPYTQITQENIPAVRGLSAVYGLGQIPGTWIEGMQLSKGTGSVVNGYESIAGQLNVELHKPIHDERLIVNGYAGQGGRFETNVVANQPLNDKWSTGLLLHASDRVRETDMNKDGFMDNPIGTNYNLMNRWDYRTETGFESQFGVGIATEDKQGGQLNSIANRYDFSLSNRKYEGFLKAGYVFAGSKYKSIGFQSSVQRYEHDSKFGIQNAYSGDQNTLYFNLIYQSIIGNTDHKFRTGLSYLQDEYKENFNLQAYSRRESVPGAFFEYTWTPSEHFSMVAGLRDDLHNLFGNFVTPRLHARYEITHRQILRLSTGRGQKTANIFAENNGLMASSRVWNIQSQNPSLPYGLQPEVAWNTGLNYTWNFELDYREGSFSVDLYRTDFMSQVVIDLDQSARQVAIHNLQGKSFANSAQVELEYELFKHLDVKLAYRFYDVQMQYNRYLAQRPMVSKHRAFFNVGYETMNNWLFDATLSWIGQKRLPYTGDNPASLQLSNQSSAYFLLNAQVTKKFAEKFEAYVGMENITNFKQQNAIVASGEPNGPYFDSSFVWGPVFGRMSYVGFRYTLRKG
ncbi:MAG: carboxypeptidase-like regulatory domain-containing protein [Bacteroidota bacterium]